MPKKVFYSFTSLILVLVVAFAGVTPALAAPPANDNFVDAVAIASLPFSVVVDATEASTEFGEPSYCVPMERTVWYSFTPTNNIVVRMNTQGSAVSSNVIAYRSFGPGIFSLTPLECAASGNSATFTAEAGQIYYLQVSSTNGQVGNLQLNLEEAPPPANDNFSNATVIPSPLPFSDTVDTKTASREVGEPVPSCAYSTTSPTVWYSFTSVTSESISVLSNFGIFPAIAAYTGNSLTSLTELGCQNFNNVLRFHVDAGTTYYLQVGGVGGPFSDRGTLGFQVDLTPPPTANFYFSPFDPSVFDTIQFCDNSFDPVNIGIQSFTWNFGDGATSTDSCVFHKYSADGNYPVQHSVKTFDGRTASTSQVVQIRTHDVSISKVSAPNSGNVGQTRTITVDIKNVRYAETVRIDLYRSVPGGFEQVAFSTQFVPVRMGNRTTQFSFNYTFSPQDAQAGKVTFKAIVTLVSARDSFPADNEGISTPPTKVNR